MTIIEKMYDGQELSEKELKYLATGFSLDYVEPGDYIHVDEFDGDIGRWTQSVQTIIQAGEDFWAIDWERGLTEIQENEFYDQPYRVIRKEKQITQVYYEQVKE